jgi:hypothetical protein
VRSLGYLVSNERRVPWEWINLGGSATVTLHHVPSEVQLADFFTKAQTQAQHRFLLSKLSVVDPL